MAKTTVEQCLSIGISDVLGQKHGVSRGEIRWSWFGGRTSTIGYETIWNKFAPVVVLRYADDESGKGAIELPIELQRTRLHHGGDRWWFSCPIRKDGARCGRRCGTLHLPTHGDLFGCRECYNLTYQSSQEAHQLERLFPELSGFRRK